MVYNTPLSFTQAKNNSITFKSSFRSNAQIEPYIKLADNYDLADFSDTLSTLENDGKNITYFVENGVYKISKEDQVPLIKILVRDNESMQVKEVRSILIGSRTLETKREDVLSEISRILKRSSEYIKSSDFRKNVLEKIKKTMV